MSPIRTQQTRVVSDLMTRNVATCRANDSLAEAARIMWDRDCGFVPVTHPETGRLVGVITDRDICMAAWSREVPLQDVPVSTVMCQDVASIRSDEDLDTIHTTMRERQIRRIPVLDDDDRVIGVISLNDLSLRAAEMTGGEGERQCIEVAETLSVICRHRSS